MFRSVTSRIVVTFLAALVLVVGCASFATFRYVRWLEHGKTDSDGVAAAQCCAAVLDVIGENNVDLKDPQQYAFYRGILRDICREHDVSHLYAYECDLESRTFTYLMCVAADDAEDAQVARERGYGTTVQRGAAEPELRALQGDFTTKAIEYDNAYGHTLDWVVGVDGWDGKVLAAASCPVDQQRSRVFMSMVTILVPFVLATIAILTVQLLVMRRYVFKPIRMIAERMRAFSPERAGDIEALEVRQNDEMRDIADAFEKMASEISEYASSIERLTEERLQATVELDVARRIQLGVVPERTELGGKGFEAAALSRAARAVGGDFYDVFRLEDGRIAAVVGDSSGKGVAAALFMVMVKTMIGEGLKAGRGPAAVLNSVNERLCESNPEGMFVTVFACVFDPSIGEVRYANAGHVPPLVVGDGVRAVKTDPGALLGLFDDVSLEEGSVSLDCGESLLVFTDGATEAVNAKRRFLGNAAFAKCIAGKAPYAGAGELVDEAARAVEDFAAGCEQFDDLTVVALMRRSEDAPPAATDALPAATDAPLAGAIEIAPDIASIRVMREAILATDHDDALKRKACLACEEAFSNVISYSGAGRAWYVIEDIPAGLRLTLADDGAPFDPVAVQSPDREFEDLDEGGMGIDLVRQLASDVRYRLEGGRNVLVIEFFD